MSEDRAVVAGMILRRPTLFDLLELAEDARADEIAQQVALNGGEWDIDAVAAQHYARIGHKFVLATPEGRPVSAGGWDPIGPGVWESWMIGTQANWERHWRAITKGSRLVMDRLFLAGARRLQTLSLVSRGAACHWHERGLLMTREATLRGYGANGEDVALFARLRPGFEV